MVPVPVWTILGLALLCSLSTFAFVCASVSNSDMGPVENLYENSEESTVGGAVVFRGRDGTLLLRKRSALGLFGLATKRPQKSAADLVHPPPLDAFMSVRGRKRSFTKSPLGPWEGPPLFYISRGGRSLA